MIASFFVRGVQRCALLMALAAGIAACSSIRLERLVAYAPGAVPGREAAASAWDAEGSPRPAYIVGASDEVEIQIVRADGVALPATVTAADSPALSLLQAVPVARLRMGLLRELGAIAVSASGAPTRIDTDFPIPVAWSGVREAFDAKSVACGAAQCQLRLSLLPRAAIYPLPGDRLTLQRSYLESTPLGEPAPQVTTQSFEVSVDAQGWAALPLLPPVTFSSAATQGDQQATTSGQVGVPALRRVGAHIHDSYARIRVWTPQGTGDTRATLDEVNDCLSVSSVMPEAGTCLRDDESATPLRLPDGFVARCRAIGVGTQFRSCPPYANAVQYRLTPGPAIWRLVDEAGLERTLAYRYGATVADAVRTHYPYLRGRALPARGSGARRVYLTVLPGQAAPPAAPFWLRLDQAAPADGDPLLHPGDTVFVSRSRPRPMPQDSN